MRKRQIFILIMVIVLFALGCASLVACSPDDNTLKDVTIEFYNGDKLVQTMKYEKDMVYPVLTEPTRNFLGWYFDKLWLTDQLTKESENKLVPGVNKVYAKWENKQVLNVSANIYGKIIEIEKCYEGDSLEKVDKQVKAYFAELEEENTAKIVAKTPNILGYYKNGAKQTANYKLQNGDVLDVNLMSDGLVIEQGKVKRMTDKMSAEVYIPFEFEDYEVYRIDGRYEADTVGSATNYWKGAFQDCANMLKVYIPNSITEIATQAFANTLNLDSIKIPASVEKIENGAFEVSAGVSYTRSIVFDEYSKVTEIPDGAFHSLRSLENIVLPQGLKKIGVQAFAGCSFLKMIALPDSLEEIGVNAFVNCKRLEQVLMPGGIQKIDATAEKNDGSIERVGIFMGCSKNLVIGINADYSNDNKLPTTCEAGWSSEGQIIWSPVEIDYVTADGDEGVSVVGQHFEKFINNDYYIGGFVKPVSSDGKVFKGFYIGGVQYVNEEGIYKAEVKEKFFKLILEGKLIEAKFE